MTLFVLFVYENKATGWMKLVKLNYIACNHILEEILYKKFRLHFNIYEMFF